MRLKSFYILLLLTIVFACSSDDDPINEIEIPEEEVDKPGDDGDDDKKIVTFKLNVSKNEVNIFEMIEFNVNVDDMGPLAPLFSLREVYDSIVWSVSDVEGRYKIFQHSHDESDSHVQFKFGWGHDFFLPGEYDTYLHGYKDNKVIYGDTLSVNITDNKDFLGYNWIDIKGSLGHSSGCHSVLSDYELATYQNVYDGVPGITFFIWNTSGRPSGIILSDYITKLYGFPKYDNDNETLLLEKYDELFNYKEEGSIPEAIWTTTSSLIVLLKVPHRLDNRKYEIYAEPIK